MEIILYLFAMYGITFGLQHKLPAASAESLKNIFKEGILDSLLSCTYCVGFHAGWIVYVLSFAARDWEISTGEFILYAFAGASFSYFLDSVIQNLEGESYEDSEEE